MDPLVSSMKVEKAPDSTYGKIDGLNKQIWVIELPIKQPKTFDGLDVVQPSVCCSTDHLVQCLCLVPHPEHAHGVSLF